jgi:hypothetical protein
MRDWVFYPAPYSGRTDHMTHARIYSGGLVLILALVFAQPARTFQNEPNDCRGIEWGAEYNKLKGFSKVTTRSPFVYYQKENEEMTIGDARLEMVVYIFYEKKLCGAILNFKSSPNFEIIKTTLFDRYGKGYQANRYDEKYVWSGANVRITLEYDDITLKGQVIYYYLPIYEKIR